MSIDNIFKLARIATVALSMAPNYSLAQDPIDSRMVQGAMPQPASKKITDTPTSLLQYAQGVLKSGNYFVIDRYVNPHSMATGFLARNDNEESPCKTIIINFVPEKISEMELEYRAEGDRVVEYSKRSFFGRNEVIEVLCDVEGDGVIRTLNGEDRYLVVISGKPSFQFLELMFGKPGTDG